MTWTWLFFISLFTYLVFKHTLSSKKNASLPPGPPADPIIGHLRSIPSSGQDMYFYELGLKYGDVVHLKVFNQSLIILNSVQAAIDLLDKRGAINSDRPYFPIYTLLKLTYGIGFEKYGTKWRKKRAMVQQHFSKEKSKLHHPIQTREARILALNLLSTSDDRPTLFMRFSTAIIIEATYGHRLESSEDPYLKMTTEFSELLTKTGPPGGTPVDLMPLLRYFPSWFPGTYYATFARQSAPKILEIFDYPYHQVKEQMAKGLAKPSFLASLLEDYHVQGEKNEIEMDLMKHAAGTVYFAGAETTATTLSFFLLAMVLYPEFQTRAQEEIDRVVGTDRLPELQDREHLPYLDCILQETLRWNQALPTGIAHQSMKDDIYNGMLIPKGSVLITNIRAMTLNEGVYKDPFRFNPARFLSSPEGRDEPYPTGPFGFGRRICPGRHHAEDSVWICIATVLATTTISRTIGKDGKEVVPEESILVTAITSHPSPFPCDLKPRNKAAFQLLQQVVESS